ncbi:MAG: UDP-glucose 4-epimerase family protein [Plesiomonas sp.]|uniref:UDP-glucose 4-epimerase family protein n=1 Tax=Plesiomonas sp. TaxID=2486279 RepID=UPI003F34BD14
MNKLQKVMVTGSSGFVGSALCYYLHQQKISVMGVTRKKSTQPWQVVGPELSDRANWQPLLKGVDTVVHCAARVHQMNEKECNALQQYREINTAATLHLAKQAVQSGVKRFIYLSSIKVNGELSLLNQPFCADDNHIPTDPYGLSKYEAEQQLKILAQETGLEVVIIRPPLVYGEGVKANFLSMMTWVKKGIPLPFGCIDNVRSFVFIDNLIDLIVTCCSHPAAANETFLVSDDNDVSLTQLLQTIAMQMQIKSRLLPIPQSWLQSVFAILGMKSLSQRLFGDLALEVTKTKKVLHWQPPVTFEQGIKRTVDDYLLHHVK